MKRRPRTLAGRLRKIRRRRVRRPSAAEVPWSADAGCVNAAVLFTDPFPATGTAAWLEPDARGERNCTDSPF